MKIYISIFSRKGGRFQKGVSKANHRGRGCAAQMILLPRFARQLLAASFRADLTEFSACALKIQRLHASPLFRKPTSYAVLGIYTQKK
jgi:hypothetical protein